MLIGCKLWRTKVLLCVVCTLVTIVLCCTTAASATDVATTDFEDYYATLGLAAEREDATERQIKSAWRQLSKKHHPDLAGEAERQTYQRIQRAYEVLGDRRKRKVYDILGVDGLRKLEHPQQHQQAANPFMQLFGGGATQPADRGADMNVLLVVPLEDVYSGAAHSVRLTKAKICRACRGSGARSQRDIVKCPHCRGSGRLVGHVQLMPGFVQEIQQQCRHCQGHGTRVTSPCTMCNGRGTVRGGVNISVDVEAGVPEGHVVTYELEADQQPGQVPGDVLMTIVTAPHARFERAGDNLHATVTITLREALLGFQKTLTHLDGREVTLQRNGVTQHDERVELVNEGLPRHHVPSEHGKLYVTYKIKMPSTLTPQQVELLQQHMI